MEASRLPACGLYLTLVEGGSALVLPVHGGRVVQLPRNPREWRVATVSGILVENGRKGFRYCWGRGEPHTWVPLDPTPEERYYKLGCLVLSIINRVRADEGLGELFWRRL